MAEQGRDLYADGFGHRDLEEHLPVTPDTVFGIGSITKSFTCVAIMQLAERGLLSVDDPVARHLPEFAVADPNAAREIKIGHLMSHTSGLPPLPFLLFCLARSMEGDPSAEEGRRKLSESGQAPIDDAGELMARIREADVKLLCAPGRHFSYSNDGYALLGEIVARTSGEPYAAYVERHILRPAGMTSSTFSPDRVVRYPDVTTLYTSKEEDGKETVNASPKWWDAPAMLSAGFLKASARDMLRYMEIYRTGGSVGGERILSTESVAQMTAPRIRCGPGMMYGYGLMLTASYGGVSLVEHGGAIKGVAAQVSLVPERGLTAVGLSNLAGVPTTDMVLSALNARMGLPVGMKRAQPSDRAVADGALAEYAGRYVSGEGAQLAAEVAGSGNGLELEMEGKRYPARPVRHEDDPDGEAFAIKVKEQEMFLTFLRDAAGHVYGLQMGFRTVHRAKDEAPTPAA